MIKVNKLFFTVLVSAALAACGGGGDYSPPATSSIATTNLTTPVNVTTAPALVNQPFTFTTGVPSFGTNGVLTTLAFTGGGATPAFEIKTPTATVKGTTTFGSCKFKVLEITGTLPAGSPLVLNQEITVDPCQVTFDTANTVVDGTAKIEGATLTIGTLVSAVKDITVTINADRTVTIGNVNLGTVTISVVTGAV